MKKNLLRPLTAGMALALASTFASGAYAAPDTRAGDPAAAAAKHGRAGHGHAEMKRDGVMIPGVGIVPKKQLDALELTADQQKSVASLRDAQKAMHEKMRTERDARQKTVAAQLAANKLDPRALSDASEKARQALTKDGEQIREQGFALWDSLNEAQRTKLTTFVRERHEKRAEWREKRHSEGRASADRNPTPGA